jgi:hypothetical protein
MALLVRALEERAMVRQARGELDDLGFGLPKFIMGGFGRG